MSERTFYEKVYVLVRQIPIGKVSSYGRVAAMLGSAGAARQVGYAMSALKSKANNETYADIPWQRVINHQGKITIKGSEHGRLRQAELLKEEGVDVDNNLQVDMDVFLWEGLLPHEVEEILGD